MSNDYQVPLLSLSAADFNLTVGVINLHTTEFNYWIVEFSDADLTEKVSGAAKLWYGNTKTDSLYSQIIILRIRKVVVEIA